VWPYAITAEVFALNNLFAAGLLFWWPVIQPWPQTSQGPGLSIILYLFLATLPCDILSGFLVFCDRVVYPDYFSSSHPFGLSALGDQQCAGALMWTCVTVIYFVVGTIFITQLLTSGNSGEREADGPVTASGVQILSGDAPAADRAGGTGGGTGAGRPR
jgi:cytochrome c oxidase assembly factor CtaG